MSAAPSQLYYGQIQVGELLDPTLDQLNTEDLTGFGTFRQIVTRGSDLLANRLIDYIEMSIEVHRLSETPEGANIDLAEEFEKIHDIVYSKLWRRTTSSASTPIKYAPVFFPNDNCITWLE